MTPHEALLAATALHAGFQVTVTTLVYPALASAPAEGWGQVHATHSRRIVPLVAVVYAAAAAACLWVLLTGPRGVGEWVALAGTAVAAATTAAYAAPTHSRLGAAGPEPVLLKRLLYADRVRAVASVVALVGAIVG